jgi:hypothetical protein
MDICQEKFEAAPEAGNADPAGKIPDVEHVPIIRARPPAWSG